MPPAPSIRLAEALNSTQFFKAITPDLAASLDQNAKILLTVLAVLLVVHTYLLFPATSVA